MATNGAAAIKKAAAKKKPAAKKTVAKKSALSRAAVETIATGDARSAPLQAADNAGDAAASCAARARSIRIASLDLQEKAAALAEEVRATNLSHDCAQIEIDVRAAAIRVERIDATSLAKLTGLANTLDRQIVANQLLNAALIGVAQVLEGVVKVKDILGNPALRS